MYVSICKHVVCLCLSFVGKSGACGSDQVGKELCVCVSSQVTLACVSQVGLKLVGTDGV